MAQLNVADWIIVGVIAVSTLISIQRGFVREALSLVTWVAAFVVARLFSTHLAALLEGHIDQPSVRIMAAFVILFVATMIVGALINHLVGEFVRMTGLTGTDRLFGMAFGLARGVMVTVVFTAIVSATPLTEDRWWNESLLIPHFKLIEEWSKETFMGGGNKLVDRAWAVGA